MDILGLKELIPKGGDAAKADTLEREIAYTIHNDPGISLTDLAKKFGCDQRKIKRRLDSKHFIAFKFKLESSIWEQMIAMRKQAMKNAAKYLKDPDTEAGIEMTKMMVRPMAEHPNSFPHPDIDDPEFIDPGQAPRSEE